MNLGAQSAMSPGAKGANSIIYYCHFILDWVFPCLSKFEFMLKISYSSVNMLTVQKLGVVPRRPRHAFLRRKLYIGKKTTSSDDTVLIMCQT